MRILKRLSLHSSLMREVQATNRDSLIDRSYFGKQYEKVLTPEQ